MSSLINMAWVYGLRSLSVLVRVAIYLRCVWQGCQNYFTKSWLIRICMYNNRHIYDWLIFILFLRFRSSFSTTSTWPGTSASCWASGPSTSTSATPTRRRATSSGCTANNPFPFLISLPALKHQILVICMIRKLLNVITLRAPCFWFY